VKSVTFCSKSSPFLAFLDPEIAFGTIKQIEIHESKL